MTNPVSRPPEDFEKKCKQAEREHESRKLVVLLERVRKQIAERQQPEANVESPKPPLMTRGLSVAPDRPTVCES